MKRPRTPHVNWRWEWRDGKTRFHVPHFKTDSGMQGRGHASRALPKIIEFAVKEHDPEEFSIQMGGGAHSARWLKMVSEKSLYHTLRVIDVEGYEGESWQDSEAERIDGKEDKEGDNHSSVYALLDDMEYLKYETGWE